MVIESGVANNISPRSSTTSASSSLPPAKTAKTTPPPMAKSTPAAKSTPRRSSDVGAGDADASFKDEVFDVSNRSTGDDSNCSSGSSGSNEDRRGPFRGEDELATRSITVQSKRFYLDVKQNPRGRFFKIAEVLPDGSKSRVALSLTSAREFRNHLTQFNEFYASTQQQKGGANFRKGSSSSSEGDYGRSAPLKSAVIYGNGGSKVPVVGRRRYFLDFKENRRGKFLQVAEASSRAGMATRNRIVIPAQGMVEFRNNLSDLLSEFWPSDDASVGRVDEGDVSLSKGKEFPAPKSLRVHQGKVLYFDSGVNPRGSYLRISQVTTRFRTSILLPKESLSRVHSMLGEILKEFDCPKEDNDNNNNNKKPPTKSRSSLASDRAAHSKGAAGSPKGAAATKSAGAPIPVITSGGFTVSSAALAKVAEE